MDAGAPQPHAATAHAADGQYGYGIPTHEPVRLRPRLSWVSFKLDGSHGSARLSWVSFTLDGSHLSARLSWVSFKLDGSYGSASRWAALMGQL